MSLRMKMEVKTTSNYNDVDDDDEDDETDDNGGKTMRGRLQIIKKFPHTTHLQQTTLNSY